GFQFKPVRAVDCLVTGYFNPYDYSNHPPDELAIKTHPEGDSWRVTIPLPAGQLPNNPLEHGPLSDRALHVGIFEPIDWILASTSACRDEPEIGSLDDQGVPRLKQIY
ncbi:MAG: hypothetical protein JWL89_697, partial [Candidatus Saccharibacteria bacterium]|nr:hypothetical protein [Candidatus Saccharibacteria bacterium]